MAGPRIEPVSKLWIPGFDPEPEKPVLSLSELNTIAAEFGLSFFTEHQNFAVLNGPEYVREIAPMLADRCEEVGSRWCEALRYSRHYYACVDMPPGFTLVD